MRAEEADVGDAVGSEAAIVVAVDVGSGRQDGLRSFARPSMSADLRETRSLAS